MAGSISMSMSKPSRNVTNVVSDADSQPRYNGLALSDIVSTSTLALSRIAVSMPASASGSSSITFSTLARSRSGIAGAGLDTTPRACDCGAFGSAGATFFFFFLTATGRLLLRLRLRFALNAVRPQFQLVQPHAFDRIFLTRPGRCQVDAHHSESHHQRQVVYAVSVHCLVP